MTKLTINDRLNFTLASLKKNGFIFLISIPFLVVGLIVAYFAKRVDDSFGLYVFGITFIIVPLLIIIYTFPSSFMYYYEQAMTKKYGYYTKATVTNKEIEDVSSRRSIAEGVGVIKEYNYLISYTFNYKSITYSNSFYVDSETVFNEIKLQSLVPIKFLRIEPKKTTVLIS